IVVKPGEGAADHAVAKVSRTLECSDSTRELLPDAKVARAPRHLIAEAEQARGPATDGAFAGGRHGLDMRIDAASKIEAAGWRSSNPQREFYPRHVSTLGPPIGCSLG